MRNLIQPQMQFGEVDIASIAPCIRLLEPPAGQHVPFINPVEVGAVPFSQSRYRFTDK